MFEIAICASFRLHTA